jgi:hypothetical protein
VEAILEHPDDATLEGLMNRIRHGPGRVDAIHVSEEAERGYSDFQIVSPREIG